ncbi:MAG: hypothetical protein OEZ39_01960 [Gammaproteobacteria bacterium]|nr:hypothetical protein [Gammaproteobacteria bacterium]MDH5650619.1 hypothetical protein [Gammaproteobacteria bacterium]
MQEIIYRGGHVVVAEPDEPFMRINLIHFDDKVNQLRESATGFTVDDVPPWQQHIFRFRVVSVLSGNLLPDARIEVIEADSDSSQSAHFKYCAMRMNVSSDHNLYAQQFEFADDAPRILFLRELFSPGFGRDSPDRGFEFIARGGMEGLDALESVQTLLEKRTFFS